VTDCAANSYEFPSIFTAHPLRTDTAFRPPSSLLHRPSSVVHRLSSIVCRPPPSVVRPPAEWHPLVLRRVVQTCFGAVENPGGSLKRSLGMATPPSSLACPEGFSRGSILDILSYLTTSTFLVLYSIFPIRPPSSAFCPLPIRPPSSVLRRPYPHIHQ